MQITQITENKKDYLDMLLLADPEEEMIDRYLEKAICLYLPMRGRRLLSV